MTTFLKKDVKILSSNDECSKVLIWNPDRDPNRLCDKDLIFRLCLVIGILRYIPDTVPIRDNLLGALLMLVKRIIRKIFY